MGAALLFKRLDDVNALTERSGIGCLTWRSRAAHLTSYLFFCRWTTRCVKYLWSGNRATANDKPLAVAAFKLVFSVVYLAFPGGEFAKATFVLQIGYVEGFQSTQTHNRIEVFRESQSDISGRYTRGFSAFEGFYGDVFDRENWRFCHSFEVVAQ